METFKRLESEVRSYVRSFPTVFTKAKGHKLYDEQGREYIDFFAGAGALNYGHNPDAIKEKVIEYLAGDGIVHSLDMASDAKRTFLERFDEVILKPRKMSYKVQFPGPTGTNAVEAALKLARKLTGRQEVLGFTNAFHGMTQGSLAVTGNRFKRKGAGVPLANGTNLPFDGYLGEGVDTTDYLERVITDGGSGVDLPAAIIVETVQGEGGLNAASFEWLKKVERICREHDILFIVDDIQAGCGRTGTFFSFEPAGLSPDMICLSKSIGGIGLPMAITLIKPELDKWTPGEHNGTFRGNNPAFVAATAALRYWEDDTLARSVQDKSKRIRERLEALVKRHPVLDAHVRGRGFLTGFAVGEPDMAGEICTAAFERGLIMETSGPDSEVVKLMPPLTIDDEGLEAGLKILDEAVAAVADKHKAAGKKPRKIA